MVTSLRARRPTHFSMSSTTVNAAGMMSSVSTALNKIAMELLSDCGNDTLKFYRTELKRHFTRTLLTGILPGYNIMTSNLEHEHGIRRNGLFGWNADRFGRA